MLNDVHEEIRQNGLMANICPMFDNHLWTELIRNEYYGPVWDVTRQRVMRLIWTEAFEMAQVYVPFIITDHIVKSEETLNNAS